MLVNLDQFDMAAVGRLVRLAKLLEKFEFFALSGSESWNILKRVAINHFACLVHISNRTVDALRLIKMLVASNLIGPALFKCAFNGRKPSYSTESSVTCFLVCQVHSLSKFHLSDLLLGLDLSGSVVSRVGVVLHGHVDLAVLLLASSRTSRVVILLLLDIIVLPHHNWSSATRSMRHSVHHLNVTWLDSLGCRLKLKLHILACQIGRSVDGFELVGVGVVVGFNNVPFPAV